MLGECLKRLDSCQNPGMPAPLRHCDTLRLFTSAMPTPVGDTTCKRVVDVGAPMGPLEDRRPLRMTIYHYPGCPLNLCAAEHRTRAPCGAESGVEP